MREKSLQQGTGDNVTIFEDESRTREVPEHEIWHMGLSYSYLINIVIAVVCVDLGGQWTRRSASLKT